MPFINRYSFRSNEILSKCKSCSYPRRSYPKRSSKYRALSASKPKAHESPQPIKNETLLENWTLSYPITKSFTLGTFAGALGSLVGMGGGFIIIPSLTSKWFRVSQHVAHGTSLFAVAATGIAGAVGYGFQNTDPTKNVDVESALALAVGGMITARLGANMATKIPEKMLKMILGSYMISIAPLVYAKASFINHDTQEVQDKVTVEDKAKDYQNILFSGLIGLFSGFLAGLLGIGGGSVVVPALCVSSDMSYHSALGTSLFAMTMPAMVGTYAHFRNGHVITNIAPGLASGNLIGAYLGGKFASANIPEDRLRFAFSSLMLLLGLRTLRKL